MALNQQLQKIYKTLLLQSTERHGSASFPVTMQLRSAYEQKVFYYYLAINAETHNRTPLLWIGGIESTTAKYLQEHCFSKAQNVMVLHHIR